MNKTAILLGATGLTGRILLNLLLFDPNYKKIKVISRTTVGFKNPKLEEHLIDLFELEKHKEIFFADEVFCCVGTTKAKTPDKETYRKIDYGIPVVAAKLCKENNINTFIVISAMGANTKSTIFYNKIKGEMERDVIKQNLKNTYILQPGLIVGVRNEKRIGEKIGGIILKFLNPIVPKKYRTISPEIIAKAMIVLTRSEYFETRIENHIIKELANNA